MSKCSCFMVFDTIGSIIYILISNNIFSSSGFFIGIIVLSKDQLCGRFQITRKKGGVA